MFGVLLGGLSLAGLIWTVQGGPDGCGPRHRHHHLERKKRRLLSWVFDELDTTPAQERLIQSAVDELLDELAEARAELFASRGQLAQAFTVELVDEAALDQVFHGWEEQLARLRGRAVKSLRDVHAVLDEAQRERLAALIERAAGRRHRRRYRGGL